MAEPPTAPLDLAAPGARDELLATKVNLPRTRPDRLARSRLFRRLDEGMGRPLVLVCTPAGFGKTTLLAGWAADAALPVAWLSLDPDDNDPARFWRYVVAALDRVEGGLGEQLVPLLSPGSGVSSQGVVAALINRLQDQPDELALVLDDYHLIDEPAIHDSLAMLLSHLPPRLHVVIASRSDPPLPLARWRASGQLAELRAADLRFTPEEAAAFLQEVWKLDLPPEAVAALEARTEGWAVGLQLAALSLQGRSDPDAFLAGFAGTHRYVLDYLSEEVLGRLPDRVRVFLLQTSVLERLCGPLCDAVTGNSDGQRMLEELERANLFLVPLDEERRWWRFHHLFADLLRARLPQLQPERVPELHRRAAGWCEQHGLIDDAIRHAVAAGDTPWATRLVEEHLGETLRRGESVMLAHWLVLLPDDAVRSRPALCLAKAMTEHDRDHLESAERLLQHAKRVLDQHGQEPREFQVPTHGGMVAEVPAAIALLRAELAYDQADPDMVAAHARAALAHMADHEHGPRLFARLLVAGADWMTGRVVDTEPAFAELLAEGRAAPAPYPILKSCFMVGLVQQAQGKLGAALRTYREGLRLASEGGRYSVYHAGEAHVGIAQVLYQRNQLEEALEHATRGVECCRQVIELTELDVALVTLAWIRQAMGDPDGALEAMDEACRTYPRADAVALAYPAQSERARLLLALGQVEEAARWTQEQGLTDQDEVSYLREGDHLVLARVLLARAQPEQALRLLERLDTLAASQGRTGSLLQVRALRSLALQAAGDHQAALILLAGTLELTAPEGYVRVFADEGPPMAALLRSLIGARRRRRGAAGGEGVATEHVHRVTQAFQPAMAQSDKTAPTVLGLIDPLTDRELEVLRLLAAGRRNRDIAQELVVSLETVKKHTSHIFAKLGAANRTQAVARARELGLGP
ncbi:MAG TPA: LuxR C-terminal-related transcriptional regulator [Actinomycetes bacterium]|nr:LuxR C-terminal-related transcriptional regulator [Actinomycetes bacterium]